MGVKDCRTGAATGNAEGEMINAMLQTYDDSEVDAILAISTPCLAAACTSVKPKPVIFTCVSDPIAAGAGKGQAEHLPVVLCVGSFPIVARTLELMQKLVPGLRAVGAMCNPAEANSATEMAGAREVYRNHGVRLEEVQAVWVPSDNTVIEG